MEQWFECWTCEHETPQTRLAFTIFCRVQEMFTKAQTGEVLSKRYAVLMASHGFYKCKKCDAPNYHVHEYWPTEAAPALVEAETLDMHQAISATGLWDDKKLFRYCHLPGFQKTPMPEWTKELPEVLMSLFWQTYAAEAKGMNTLCAMGIRAIIDFYAVGKVGDCGGFDKKLLALKDNRNVSERQYELLSILTEAGNAASHRGFTPTASQIRACLSVLEAIFFFEVKNGHLEDLKKSIPSRPKKT